MTPHDASSSESGTRVVRFPSGRAQRPPRGDLPDDHLSKYQTTREDAAEYRHRMIVNAAALLFVIGLIGAALWLADSMATMRKNQDCVLSGRSGCTPVETTRNRW